MARLLLWALYEYDDAEPVIFCPDEADEVRMDVFCNVVLMIDTLSCDGRRFQSCNLHV